jgi:hypothetical protein
MVYSERNFPSLCSSHKHAEPDRNPSITMAMILFFERPRHHHPITRTHPFASSTWTRDNMDVQKCHPPKESEPQIPTAKRRKQNTPHHSGPSPVHLLTIPHPLLIPVNALRNPARNPHLAVPLIRLPKPHHLPQVTPPRHKHPLHTPAMRLPDTSLFARARALDGPLLEIRELSET